MSHSPEPWTYCEAMSEGGEPTDPSTGSSDLGGFLDADGLPICWFGNNEQYYPTNGTDPSAEDAARIVACVNFCAGVPTETLLEAKAIDRFLAKVRVAERTADFVSHPAQSPEHIELEPGTAIQFTDPLNPSVVIACMIGKPASFDGLDP